MIYMMYINYENARIEAERKLFVAESDHVAIDYGVTTGKALHEQYGGVLVRIERFDSMLTIGADGTATAQQRTSAILRRTWEAQWEPFYKEGSE